VGSSPGLDDEVKEDILTYIGEEGFNEKNTSIVKKSLNFNI